MQTSSSMTPLEGESEHTIGGLADPSDAPITHFARVDAEELHDQDDRVSPPLVTRNSFNEDNDSDSDGNNNDDDDDDERKDNFLMNL
jgi:hypothetical protein